MARRFSLLPDDPRIGWEPYLWLVYLGFLPVGLFFGPSTPGDWWLLGAVVVAFLPLYFLGYWVRGWRLIAVIAAITTLGVLYQSHNASAGNFFVYAAAFLGSGWRPRPAALGVVVIAVVALLSGWSTQTFPLMWAWAPVIVLVIGGVCIHRAEEIRGNDRLRMAHDEVERLAKRAERERIGRDLHDLLGHTLSVIALKAELAAKLAERDPARSRREIEEVHAISRQALGDVREAVAGYRGVRGSLADELDNARRVLGSAGVAVTAEAVPAGLAERLGPGREVVLALALREAVTNVLRHARATRSRIALATTADQVCLEVSDDGRGGAVAEGAGLTGMRERVETLGGTLHRETSAGTRLVISLPLPRVGEPAAVPP
ncbi:MAG: sensor histidine kinase [Thermoanaerobaculia bacterium]|nr:sensor histidine kinase [Thermoanaerobaculia bacterium]